MIMKFPEEAKNVLASRDPIMGALIEHLEPYEYHISDPFHALVDIIIGQQISEIAKAAIMKRFKQAFTPITKDTIQNSSVADLKAVGLSAMKAQTIKRLADSDIDFNALKTMSNDDIETTLLNIKGIGPWSVDMFKFVALNDPDVLSLKDIAIVNALKRCYGVEKHDMPAFKEQFSPYGSTAAAYLWRALDVDQATLNSILKDVNT